VRDAPRGSGPEELEARIAEALDRASRRREEEHSSRAQEMRDLDSRRTEFERVAGEWIRHVAVSRLRIVARAFSQAEEVECERDGCSARLEFRRTEEYPVSASLTVSVIPDTRYEHACLRVEPSLIPMFVGHPQVATCDCEVTRSGIQAPAGFLDNALLVFVERYLRVRDPGSPYQKSLMVTDPVCGCRSLGTRFRKSWSRRGSSTSSAPLPAPSDSGPSPTDIEASLVGRRRHERAPGSRDEPAQTQETER
jgi:hypothetical protein